MKQEKFVVHSKGISEVLFTTQFSKRNIFKNLLVFGYAILITVIIFHFNLFKDSIKNVWDSENNFVLQTNDILKIAKLNSSILIWDVFLVLIQIRLLKRTLKMLQNSGRNVFVFLLFSMLFFAYGIFISIYLPGWMNNRISNLKDYEWFKGYKFLSAIFYFYLVLPISSSVWYFANAINEKRVSPYISRNHFLYSIVLVFWSLMIGASAWLAQLLLLGDKTESFDYTNDFQMFLILSIFVLVLITLFGNYYIKMKFSKGINNKLFYKDSVQAISIVIIFPLAIWLISTYFKYYGDWMEWIYISIVSIVLTLAIVYTFIAKTELGSSKIFMVVMSLALTIIWMCKFFFEYLWGYKINQEFTMPIAILGSAIIFTLIYFKSPSASKLLLYILSKFSKLLWIIVMASWAIGFVPYIDKVFPFIPELISVLLMALPIAIFVISLFNWYIVQWRIKFLSAIKKEKGGTYV